LGGPETGSFEGGINLKRTYFFQNVEVEEKKSTLGGSK
jgi:hypothetical protein